VKQESTDVNGLKKIHPGPKCFADIWVFARIPTVLNDVCVARLPAESTACTSGCGHNTGVVMRVGLVFGGKSVEHLVSVRSARAVRSGLQEAGHDVVPLGITETGRFTSRAQAELALDGEVDALRGADDEPAPAKTFAGWLDDVDVVFPINHGTFGEDGRLQGMLDMMDVPYVGAPVAASAIAMDKAVCKEVLAAHGIAVVEHQLVRKGDFDDDAAACVARVMADERLGDFPLFVKPSVGGSSVGCKRANSQDELHDALRFALGFHDVALVERHVSGRELECAVLGNETGAPHASCIGEIVPGADFYDYADKYVNDDAGLLAPAPLDDATRDRLQAMAQEAFVAIGAQGMARVDFFLEGEGDDAVLCVNEINTLPGFTRISMYPRLWGETGKPLPALVDELVQLAVQRHAREHATDAAIRTWVSEQS